MVKLLLAALMLGEVEAVEVRRDEEVKFWMFLVLL